MQEDAKKKLSEYTEELDEPTDVTKVVLYGVEDGKSVKVPVSSLPQQEGGGGDAPDMENYVDKTSAQSITGMKTFVGNKLVNFQQRQNNDKLGFTYKARDNKELAYFEYNADNGIRGFYLGNYFKETANQYKTQIGFQIQDISAAVDFAYHLIAPMAENIVADNSELKKNYSSNSGAAKIKNFFLPLYFVNGDRKVTASEGGTVDLGALFATSYTNGTRVVSASSIDHDTTNIETTEYLINDIVIVADLSNDTPLTYRYRGEIKTLYGNSDFDVPFRYVGNHEFKPIAFPFIIN